jgi:putative acetyltransferase
MTVTVRPIRPEEARAFLEVHHAAVRGIAGRDYPPAVIEDWAPLPITDKVVERLLVNPDDEIRLVAEIDGAIVGIGAVVLARAELRACYVEPGAARKGVGSALVHAIERIARAHKLPFLELDSSVTAEPFYLALGYDVRARGEHVLGSGRFMACVRMRKDFSPQDA